MKKIMHFVSCVMCVIILLVSLSAGAYAFYEPNIEDLTDTKIVDCGLTQVSSIDSRNMYRIKNIRSKTSQEKSQELFDSLGYEYNIDNPVITDIASRMDDIVDVVSQKQIIEVSPDGNQRIITQSEYEKIVKEEAETAHSSSNRTNRYSHEGEYTSPNGYMQQGITAFYLGDKEGLYRIIGLCLWLKTPVTRGVDAVSLGSGDIIVWDNYPDGEYYGGALYTETTIINGSVRKQDICVDMPNPPMLGSTQNGFYYTWRLPIDTASNNGTVASVTYKNLRFVMAGNCYVQDYDDHTQRLYVKLRYSHSQVKVAIENSFSPIGSDSVFAVSAAIKIFMKDYVSSLSWDYNSEF